MLCNSVIYFFFFVKKQLSPFTLHRLSWLIKIILICGLKILLCLCYRLLLLDVFILPCISLLGSYSSKVSLRSPPKVGPMKNRSRPDGSTEYPSWVSGLGKEYPSWVEDLDTTGRHRKKERSVFKHDIHCN